MTKNLIFISIVVFFISIIASRLIMTRGTSFLDDETKLQFFKVFPRTNTISLIIVIVLILGYLGLAMYFPQYRGIASVVYFSLYFIYLVISSIGGYRKLVNMSVPQAYMRHYFAALAVYLLGFFCIGAVVFSNLKLY